MVILWGSPDIARDRFKTEFKGAQSLVDSTKVSEKRLFYASIFVHSGSLVASKLLVAPLDRLKLLHQCGSLPRTGWSGYQNHLPYQGLQQAAKFWLRGTGTHLLQATSSSFLRLFMYQYYCNELVQHDSSLSQTMTGHIFAGITSLIVLYPLDVRYTKLGGNIMKPLPTDSFWKRVRAKYTGLPLACLGGGAYLSAAIGTHHLLKSAAPDMAGEYPGNIIGGSVAGLVGAAVTYPIDTWRRRRIVGSKPLVSIRDAYRGFGVYTAKLVPEYLAILWLYQKIHQYIF